MTYHNAEKYLRSAVDAYPDEHGYERIQYLLSCFGEHQKSLRYLRLAGSNGKSICTSMLGEVLHRTEYRVGIVDLSERRSPCEAIRIGMSHITMDEASELFGRISATVLEKKKLIASLSKREEENEEPLEKADDLPESIQNGKIPIEPTADEILLLAALQYFRENQCHFCVVESNHATHDCTLGLPAPFATVICGSIPVGDREELANIKRYIQRGVGEIVSAPQDGDSYRVISDTCASVNCRLSVPARSSFHVSRCTLKGIDFTYRDVPYSLKLCGQFQILNAGTVIETVQMLRRCGYRISDEALREGLTHTTLSARMELISSAPFIMIDSTHKREAIPAICASLYDFTAYTGKELTLCLGGSAELLEPYLQHAVARGFSIKKIFIYCDEEEYGTLCNVAGEIPITVLEGRMAKAAKTVLSALGTGDYLLVEGEHEFAMQLRYEILRQMGY